MNPGEEMIKVTQVEPRYPYNDTPILINRRDVFTITPDDRNQWKARIVIVRWNEIRNFRIKETEEELLRLMGRKEE